MLVYFTSGTTGDPKMVEHDYTHPLGHIVTAKYWQQVQENKLHMSVSDSGWAKFGWGKIYGQWICGAVIFAYDMDKFVPTHLLQKMQDYKLTTFCAPPTMYRFMLQEDVASYDLSSIQNFSTAGEPLNPEVYNRWQELTGKEIREGKVTLPLLHALQTGRREEAEHCLHIINEKDFTTENIDLLIDFAKANGGIEYAEQRMQVYHDKAVEVLMTLPESEAREGLLLLADYIVERRK